MVLEEIGRGAEAIIYLDDDKGNKSIVKVRPPKSYRHKKLDSELIRTRTKKEAKVLNDLKRIGVKAPDLELVDLDKGIIRMSFIDGKKLRDVFDDNIFLIKDVARIISKLHDANIIHGDLTTSNFILSDDEELFLIDFGLTFHSTRIEDRAVDIHLLKQALESKHYLVADKAWSLFLEHYNPVNKDAVIARFKEVELRGRNKHG